MSELLAWLDENERRDLSLRACRAGALAMLGRFDEARAILAEARAEQAERGGGIQLADDDRHVFRRRRALGRRSRRCPRARSRRVQAVGRTGEQAQLPTAAGKLAQALYPLDRLEEADAWAGRAAELGASDDA